MRLHTEKEHLINNSMQIFNLEILLKENPSEFYDFSSFLPFYLHKNSRTNLDWFWANSSAVDAIGTNNRNKTENSKIYKLSDKRFFENCEIIIDRYNKKNDTMEICSIIQRMKIKGKWSWIITNKKIINEAEYLNFSYNVDDILGAGNYIKDKLDNTFNDIYAWQKFQSLSKREKEILKLVANGKTTQDISEIHSISTGTVRKHRENINRKIEARSIFDIIRFADGFGLIGAL